MKKKISKKNYEKLLHHYQYSGGNIFDDIGNTFRGVGDKVVGTFRDLGYDIKNTAENTFNSVWNTLSFDQRVALLVQIAQAQAVAAEDATRQAADSVKNTANQAVDSVKSAAETFVDKVKGEFESVAPSLEIFGNDFVEGLRIDIGALETGFAAIGNYVIAHPQIFIKLAVCIALCIALPELAPDIAIHYSFELLPEILATTPLGATKPTQEQIQQAVDKAVAGLKSNPKYIAAYAVLKKFLNEDLFDAVQYTLKIRPIYSTAIDPDLPNMVPFFPGWSGNVNGVDVNIPKLEYDEIDLALDVDNFDVYAFNSVTKVHYNGSNMADMFSVNGVQTGYDLDYWKTKINAATMPTSVGSAKLLTGSTLPYDDDDDDDADDDNEDGHP